MLRETNKNYQDVSVAHATMLATDSIRREMPNGDTGGTGVWHRPDNRARGQMHTKRMANGRDARIRANEMKANPQMAEFICVRRNNSIAV